MIAWLNVAVTVLLVPTATAFLTGLTEVTANTPSVVPGGLLPPSPLSSLPLLLLLLV
ncbi:hypothetical protein [uncultured Marinobacter sp.]|uniref:hypothetical protein n=1 Tax=uncultured Marinobacter sp. TaxID=187379 RepID=UPI0030D741B1